MGIQPKDVGKERVFSSRNVRFLHDLWTYLPLHNPPFVSHPQRGSQKNGLTLDISDYITLVSFPGCTWWIKEWVNEDFPSITRCKERPPLASTHAHTPLHWNTPLRSLSVYVQPHQGAGVSCHGSCWDAPNLIRSQREMRHAGVESVLITWTYSDWLNYESGFQNDAILKMTHRGRHPSA